MTGENLVIHGVAKEDPRKLVDIFYLPSGCPYCQYETDHPVYLNIGTQIVLVCQRCREKFKWGGE